eukprot:g745.t1
MIGGSLRDILGPNYGAGDSASSSSSEHIEDAEVRERLDACVDSIVQDICAEVWEENSEVIRASALVAAEGRPLGSPSVSPLYQQMNAGVFMEDGRTVSSVFGFGSVDDLEEDEDGSEPITLHAPTAVVPVQAQNQNLHQIPPRDAEETTGMLLPHQQVLAASQQVEELQRLQLAAVVPPSAPLVPPRGPPRRRFRVRDVRNMVNEFVTVVREFHGSENETDRMPEPGELRKFSMEDLKKRLSEIEVAEPQAPTATSGAARARRAEADAPVEVVLGGGAGGGEGDEADGDGGETGEQGAAPQSFKSLLAEEKVEMEKWTEARAAAAATEHQLAPLRAVHPAGLGRLHHPPPLHEQPPPRQIQGYLELLTDTFHELHKDRIYVREQLLDLHTSHRWKTGVGISPLYSLKMQGGPLQRNAENEAAVHLLPTAVGAGHLTAATHLAASPTWNEFTGLLQKECLKARGGLPAGNEGDDAEFVADRYPMQEEDLDALLFAEIREEEKSWLRVDSDLISVKNQLANAIFDELLGEAVLDLVRVCKGPDELLVAGSGEALTAGYQDSLSISRLNIQ